MITDKCVLIVVVVLSKCARACLALIFSYCLYSIFVSVCVCVVRLYLVVFGGRRHDGVGGFLCSAAGRVEAAAYVELRPLLMMLLLFKLCRS